MSGEQAEGDPELRRIIFDLPGQHVPELMAVLGEFALTHNFQVEFKDIPDEVTNPSLTLESGPKFKEENITWMQDEEAGEYVAITTRNHLLASAKENYGSTSLGERVANSMFYHNRDRPEVIPFLFVVSPGQPIGLRTERIPGLISLLSSRIAFFRNIGEKSIELLQTYYDQTLVDTEG